MTDITKRETIVEEFLNFEITIEPKNKPDGRAYTNPNHNVFKLKTTYPVKMVLNFSTVLSRDENHVARQVPVKLDPSNPQHVIMNLADNLTDAMQFTDQTKFHIQYSTCLE